MDLKALYQILIETLAGWVESFVAHLPNIVAALLIVTAFGLLSRWAERLVERLIARLTRTEAIVRLCGSMARWGTVLGGVFIALNVLQLDNAVMSLLAGAGVVGLALGFAFQDLAANFIAGVFMGFRKPFQIGDVIETGGHVGNVRKLNMRNTLIETFAGPMVIVPNRLVFESALVNYSYKGVRRVELEVGVTYDADLEQVTRVLRETIEALPFLAPDTRVGTWAFRFGASSIDFKVLYWIRYQGDVGWYEAHHAGVLGIRRAFRENGITIPFPIRTLDLSLAEEQTARLRLTRERDAPGDA
jgi:small-conductance mechanosensitive channel